MRLDKKDNFEWLLAYEINGALRYRRYLSLIGISAKEQSPSVDRLLWDTARDSDVLFENDDATIVLMGETSQLGAMSAIDRYKNAMDGCADMRYAVAAFPNDGCNPSDLMQAIQRRLDAAKAKPDPGIVVSQG